MKTVKKTALAGLFSALSVVILLLGSIIDVLDMSVAAIASFIVALILIELKGKYPWLVYAVVSVLSTILLPNKFGVLLYVCFFGWYPMLKFVLDSKLKNAALRALCKFAAFALGTASMLLLYVKLFSGVIFEEGQNLIALTVILSVLAFFVYDLALGRLLLLYCVKWRKYIEKYL